MPRGINIYDEASLQNRNSASSNSINIVSPGFITDGLILHVDAANYMSYPKSGTTVYNLVGTDRGTFVADVAFQEQNGGSFIFDGSGDYLDFASSNITTYTKEATFLGWIYRNGAQVNTASLLMYNRNTGVNFYSTTNNLAYHWAAQTTYNFNSGLQPPSLAWSMYAVSVSPSRTKIYLCQSSGITSSTNTFTHNAVNVGALRIGHFGSNYPADRFFKGNIAITAVYNRSLSEEEITQNFNSTRHRFNI
jgi:hypothetical protein